RSDLGRGAPGSGRATPPAPGCDRGSRPRLRARLRGAERPATTLGPRSGNAMGEAAQGRPDGPEGVAGTVMDPVGGGERGTSLAHAEGTAGGMMGFFGSPPAFLVTL